MSAKEELEARLRAMESDLQQAKEEARRPCLGSVCFTPFHIFRSHLPLCGPLGLAPPSEVFSLPCPSRAFSSNVITFSFVVQAESQAAAAKAAKEDAARAAEEAAKASAAAETPPAASPASSFDIKPVMEDIYTMM